MTNYDEETWKAIKLLVREQRKIVLRCQKMYDMPHACFDFVTGLWSDKRFTHNPLYRNLTTEQAFQLFAV